MNDDKPKTPEPANTTPAAKPAVEQDKQDQQDKKPAGSDRDERKPEDLTAEDLRLMADTMPGEGPGDD